MEGKIKSRSLRRVKVKVPGNKSKLHYRKRKPKQAKCADCGKVLHGIPRERSYKMKNMPKTKKRPERPFGGVLCSSCMRKRIKESVR
ncbi:50S ribosomal protein L34e [Candidatus Woesearchaeota archaeon]|nr:50S ribosomal protein L34e [Candidatus Woesearchaeota archaeon]